MDSKIIYVRTRKGEDEVRGKTANLYSDIKRVLLMIDGVSALGEISKRAAPSLRRTLDEMVKELSVGGFIQEHKKGTKPQQVGPSGMSSTIKNPKTEVSELDFTVVPADTNQADKLKIEAENKLRTDVVVKAQQRQEAESLKIKAKAQAEYEAKKLKAETNLKALQEIEAKKIKVLQQSAAAKAQADQEEKQAKIEADAKARQEIEAKKFSEQQAIKAKALAELEEKRIKAEAVLKAKQDIEAEKLKEQRQVAVARARAELEASRAKAVSDANARALVEQQRKQESEALRIRNEMAEKARVEAEIKARKNIETENQLAAVARARAEMEAGKANAEDDSSVHDVAEATEKTEPESLRIKTDAEVKEKAEVEAKHEIEAARLKAEQEAADAVSGSGSGNRSIKSKSNADPSRRSTSATVLFFDVVGYTKHSVNKQIEVKKQFTQLLSDCLAALGDDERIILDTGDGAAIGFLQHPEDALEAAMQFRSTVMNGLNQGYADLKVRIGIHLGPISVVKDMNGQSNMVGDGINDAQRVMGFAGINQIFISRPYYDFISRLNDEYAELFQYRGAQKDKHGREHPVYELVDVAVPIAEAPLRQYDEASPALKLEPFSLGIPRAEIAPLHVDLYEESEQAIAVEVPAMTHPDSAMPSSKKAVDVTARPVTVDRNHSEDEVKELEGSQAKVWANAQQRAIESAKTNAQRALQSQQFMAAAVKDVPITPRARRKPVPWSKVGAGLFAVLIIALLVVPYVMPMKSYLLGVERFLTNKLQQPVHIGKMSGRLLPTPRLELSDMSVGDSKSVQIRQAQVDFSFLALFGGTRGIDSVELKGVQVKGEALAEVASWFRLVAADTRYPVRHIILNEGALEAEGLQLQDIGGDLSFDAAGIFVGSKLHAMGNKYAMEIKAAPDGKLLAAITVRGSSIPFLPSWNFDELKARGELIDDSLQITELDGRIMGGTVTGSVRISWRSGWRAQGALAAQAMTSQLLSSALSGDMDGTAQFQMQAANLPGLTETARMDGEFVIKKGVVNGVDIVETARLRSKMSAPGGRTHFEELGGAFSVVNGSYAIREFRMKSGVLNAKGALDIVRQELSGTVSADLAAGTGLGYVTLQVSGTVGNPTLHAGR